MKSFFKHKLITVLVDILSSPISLLAAVWLRPIARMIHHLPVNNKIFIGNTKAVVENLKKAL